MCFPNTLPPQALHTPLLTAASFPSFTAAVSTLQLTLSHAPG